MVISEIEILENILVEFLGEPKTRLYGELEGQRIFCCPRCAEENGGIPDGKFNLEVCFSKNLNQGGVFQCWKCSSIDDGMKGSVLKLVKRYGGNNLFRRYKEVLNSLITSNLYSLNEFYSGNTESFKIKPSLHLPSTYRKIDLSKYCKIPIRDYLEKRRIDQNIIDKFNIGYTEWEVEEKDWSYRIIIPSYDSLGNLNFYVGRDYTDNPRRPKYKNCKADKKDIIFQENYVDWDAPIYLCEGVFDCLRFPNSISLLGKHLSNTDYLYNEIRDKANSDIVICLDGDTDIIETKKIYSLLNYGRLKNHIKYIRLGENDSPYKDFSEIYENLGRKGMIKSIKSAKQFTDFELTF